MGRLTLCYEIFIVMDEKRSKLGEDMDLQQLIARIEKSEQQHKDLAKSVLKLRLEMNIYLGKPQLQSKNIIDHTRKSVSNNDANNNNVNSKTNVNIVDDGIMNRLASLEHKISNFQDILILNKFGAKNIEDLPRLDEKKDSNSKKEISANKIESEKGDEHESYKRLKACPMVYPINKVESEKRIEEEMDKHKKANSAILSIDNNAIIDEKVDHRVSNDSKMTDEKENFSDETILKMNLEKNEDKKEQTSSDSYPMVYPVLMPKIDEKENYKGNIETTPFVNPIHKAKTEDVETKMEDKDTKMEGNEPYRSLYPIDTPKVESIESNKKKVENLPMVYPIGKTVNDMIETKIESKETYPLLYPIENPITESKSDNMES